MESKNLRRLVFKVGFSDDEMMKDIRSECENPKKENMGTCTHYVKNIDDLKGMFTSKAQSIIFSEF